MTKLFDIVNKFVAEKKVERKQLMVNKGFIDSSIEYSDDLWDQFKSYRLKKWIENN